MLNHWLNLWLNLCSLLILVSHNFALSIMHLQDQRPIYSISDWSDEVVKYYEYTLLSDSMGGVLAVSQFHIILHFTCEIVRWRFENVHGMLAGQSFTCLRLYLNFDQTLHASSDRHFMLEAPKRDGLETRSSCW
jgi:hypothetical protein